MDDGRRSGTYFHGLFECRVRSVLGSNYSEVLLNKTFAWNKKLVFDLFDKGPDNYLLRGKNAGSTDT